MEPVALSTPPRYALQERVGSGAFSTVFLAKDQISKRKVIVKHINDASHPLLAKCVLREIKLLTRLKHPNIIRLHDVFISSPQRTITHSQTAANMQDLAKAAATETPDSVADCTPNGAVAGNGMKRKLSTIADDERISLVLEAMETDLHSVIQSSQPLSLKHVRYFLFQVVLGVAYLHRSHVIHRDLKPENILVNRDCTVKLCDFGSARLDRRVHLRSFTVNDLSALLPSYSSASLSLPVSPATAMSVSPFSSKQLEKKDDLSINPNAVAEEDAIAAQMTERVVTRWYRAPDVILTQGNYGTAIDMWSVGCIFAEMVLRRPLFPGKDFEEQLSMYAKVLGKPTEEMISYLDLPKARDYVRALPDARPMSLAQLFPTLDDNGRDLLSKMLRFDPRTRITAEAALQHPFFAPLFCEEDVATLKANTPAMDEMAQAFTFETSTKQKLTVFRRMIVREIAALQRAEMENRGLSQDVPMPQASSLVSSPSVQNIISNVAAAAASQPTKMVVS